MDDVPSNLRFDVVIAADVIEHMVNPMDLVDKLSTLLTDNGILIITTGDADNYLWNRFGANWWYCFYPEHITFISRAWLSYLSEIREFSVIRCETFYYRRLTAVSRLMDSIYTYIYGFFPDAYLRLAGLLKKILGRSGVTSVPGCGVGADHLFIVLARKK